MRLQTLLLLPLLLFAAQPGRGGADTSESEIHYLLGFVASSDCTFIRNGDAHDDEDAADHLRLKYSRGKRYADTAEHFIDRLASESSWSGRDYTVNCQGKVEKTGPWLHRALTEYRSKPAPGQGNPQ